MYTESNSGRNERGWRKNAVAWVRLLETLNHSCIISCTCIPKKNLFCNYYTQQGHYGGKEHK